MKVFKIVSDSDTPISLKSSKGNFLRLKSRDDEYTFNGVGEYSLYEKPVKALMKSGKVKLHIMTRQEVAVNTPAQPEEKPANAKKVTKKTSKKNTSAVKNAPKGDVDNKEVVAEMKKTFNALKKELDGTPKEDKETRKSLRGKLKELQKEIHSLEEK